MDEPANVALIQKIKLNLTRGVTMGMVTILGPLQPSPPLSATASPPSSPTSIKKKKKSKTLKKAKSPDNNGSALEAAQQDINNDPKEEQARVELIVEKARAE